MKTNNNVFDFLLKSFNAKSVKPARDEIVTLLQGVWTDVELIYLASDKKTILERELIEHVPGVSNKISFENSCVQVNLVIDNGVLSQEEKYESTYSLQGNYLSFRSSRTNQVITTEMLVIDENELWLIVDELTVEDFSKDIEDNKMYEIIRFIRC
ncbi:MAG: hypothetical protein LBE34_13480 [Flavobacteriaceae bacterium]|jgi:hypothetical protein|nr:hypothetical protein [Flavobacteriaceae bacterium]